MTNKRLIEILGSIRADYNCFDENEREKYEALSEAIRKLKTRLYEMAETGKLEHICGHCGIFEGDPNSMLGYCPLHNRNVWRDDGVCGDFRPRGCMNEISDRPR